jgi:hypothetical protein
MIEASSSLRNSMRFRARGGNGRARGEGPQWNQRVANQLTGPVMSPPIDPMDIDTPRSELFG